MSRRLKGFEHAAAAEAIMDEPGVVSLERLAEGQIHAMLAVFRELQELRQDQRGIAQAARFAAAREQQTAQ